MSKLTLFVWGTPPSGCATARNDDDDDDHDDDHDDDNYGSTNMARRWLLKARRLAMTHQVADTAAIALAAAVAHGSQDSTFGRPL